MRNVFNQFCKYVSVFLISPELEACFYIVKVFRLRVLMEINKICNNYWPFVAVFKIFLQNNV